MKRIKTLMSGMADLGAALALQEAALEASHAHTEQALALVRAARRRLAAHDPLSTDELVTLIRSTKMSEFKWTPKMDEMAAKHYTPEQLAELKARPFTAEDQARVGAAWAQIYAGIGSLGANPDVTSDAALAIGRQAFALISEFTKGDPAMLKSVSGLRSDMARDPATSSQMQGGPMGGVLGQILAELKTRGEI